MSQTSPRRFPARLSNTLTSRPAPRPGSGLSSHGPRADKYAPYSSPSDFASARARMVERLEQDGISDKEVLHALSLVHRHGFLDSALANQAYEDTSLPIGHGQTISKPSVVARMLELLNQCPLVKEGRVLEIGTGCAYQATLLALLAREVYSLERIAALHSLARKNLSPLRIKNLHLILGDGTLGYPQGAPYAGIISAAGGAQIPDTWLEQLAIGGRLVAPVQTVATQQAIVVIDRGRQGWSKKIYEGVHFVPLQVGIIR